MNTEKLKQAALKATWGGGMYATILALLECVDALQSLCDDLGTCGATEQARAALQKLEAL